MNSAQKFAHLCATQKTVWMGAVNLTPDSFSDGGCYQFPILALGRAQTLVSQGAHIIDFGGVSTNPKIRSVNVSPAEEFARVYETLKLARAKLPKHILISLDTFSPAVALRCAQENLIDIVNDVLAGQKKELIQGKEWTTTHVAAQFGLGYIMMHMAPEQLHNCVSEVVDFLTERAQWAQSLGVQYLAVDPGLGYGYFGKNLTQILELLSRESLLRLNSIGYPVLIGLSRKTFLRDLYPELESPLSRDAISKKFEYKCIEAGAKIIRSHVMNLP